MPQSLGIDWNIESVRTTAFLRTEPKTRALEDWLELTSANTPVQVAKTVSSFSGVSRSTDGFLRVDWGNGRLDATLTPTDPSTRNYVAEFMDLGRLFENYVKKFAALEDFPLIDRLAVGIVLTFAVESENIGLQLLRPAIMGLNLDPRARDVQYRSNIPFESLTSEGLLINRLATWSVGQVQTIQIRIGTDGSQSQDTVGLTPTAIRLELDINTDKNVSLNADATTCHSLLSEMQALAINIAISGESAMLN